MLYLPRDPLYCHTLYPLPISARHSSTQTNKLSSEVRRRVPDGGFWQGVPTTSQAHTELPTYLCTDKIFNI